MNDLLKINTENPERMTLSARDLHEFLGISSKYIDWFNRMVGYGFEEDEDYRAISQKKETAQGNTSTYTDHEITVDMAKEICMIQRSEKGKQAREYFIQLEKDWNKPEKVMARALVMAQKQLDFTKKELEDSKLLIEQLQPKATYYDLVLQCKDAVSTTTIAKDFGMSARKLNALLNTWGVQFCQSGRWFLYSKYEGFGYATSKTSTFTNSNGEIKAKTAMYWTQKGRMFLYELLKAKGYVPEVEKD